MASSSTAPGPEMTEHGALHPLAADYLDEALNAWEWYPLNLSRLQETERPRLISAIREHFNITKQTVLMFIDESMSWPQKNAIKRRVRTVWFDLNHVPEPGKQKRLHQSIIETREIKNINHFDERLGIASQFKGIQDPTCRFIILESSAPDSPRLKITEELLLKILTYHQVSPHFLGFIAHICQEGDTGSSHKVPFGGFQRLGSFFKPQPPADAVRLFDRSGHHYELVFELRVVCQTENLDDGATNDGSADGALKPWPILQSVIYHRFDFVTGKSLWVLTAGNNEKVAKSSPFHDADNIRDSLKGLGTSHSPNPIADRFISNLSALVHLGDWSYGDFDSYIITLERELIRLTFPLIDTLDSGLDISENTLKKLHQCMETLGECILALESNLHVCQALVNLHREDFLNNKNISALKLPWAPSKREREGLVEDIKSFHIAMESVCESISEMIRRAKGVQKTSAGREGTIYRMLQNRDTHSSAKLAEVTTLFSVITLILLPISVVSSIFSTDMIKFSQDGTGRAQFAGHWSGPAIFWFLVISFAITAIVMLVAWWLVPNLKSMLLPNRPKKKKKKKKKPTMDGKPPAKYQWINSSKFKVQEKIRDLFHGIKNEDLEHGSGQQDWQIQAVEGVEQGLEKTVSQDILTAQLDNRFTGEKGKEVSIQIGPVGGSE